MPTPTPSGCDSSSQLHYRENAPLKTPPLQRIKPEVRAIHGYHLKTYDCPVKLNQNESPFDVPDKLKAEILKTVGERPWSRYLQPMPTDLVEALARHVGWPPEGLIVCNGANTLVQLVLAVSTSPGVPIVIPSPSFSLYGLYASIFSGRVVPVDPMPDHTFNLPAIREAIHREQAHTVILCSPNNPTGCIVSNPDLEALLKKTDALVIVDEAYGEFSSSTALDLLPRHPNLIVLKTLSKAFGAAGIRIGYLLAHPNLVREVIKGKIPFDINVFSHTAALTLINRSDLFQERVAAICAERERVFGALQKIDLVCPYASHANFILFEVADADAVFNGLIEQGVLVRNLAGYPGLSKALRVSIGTPQENACFLNALREVV